MNVKTISESLASSLHIVNLAGREVNSLLDLIKQCMNLEITRLSHIVKITQAWQSNSRISETGWVMTDKAISLGLGMSGYPTGRFFNIQVSMMGDGVCTQEHENTFPLLHVYLSGSATSFLNGKCLSIGDISDQTMTLQEGVFFNGAVDAECWVDKCWSYTLYLASINCLDDIQSNIVAPFSDLMTGKDVMSSNIKKLPGIVRYESLTNRMYRVRPMQVKSQLSEEL
ncbi:hypothetical protein [Chrysiogenes arsenatis]|uniref:hypothetical protein n=1 Tax=Chrysiogenes arsenatis TaxID=309797 RepID=UPI0003FC41B1|nr:hypothetical protein [Chrysiogenes arsenatis]